MRKALPSAMEADDHPAGDLGLPDDILRSGRLERSPLSIGVSIGLRATNWDQSPPQSAISGRFRVRSSDYLNVLRSNSLTATSAEWQQSSFHRRDNLPDAPSRETACRS